MAPNAAATMVLTAGVRIEAVSEAMAEALGEVVVSEVVAVGLEAVVAVVEEIVGRFPGEGDFPDARKPRAQFWGGVTQGA